MMLASRGFVYKNAETAGMTEVFHAKCDCQIVPEFGKGSARIPGYDLDAMQEKYQEARKQAQAELRKAGINRAPTPGETAQQMRKLYADSLSDGKGVKRSNYARKASKAHKPHKAHKAHKNELKPTRQWPDGVPQRLGGIRPYDTLATTPRLEGEQSFAERVSKVNPHHGERSQWTEVWETDYPYKNNCVRCSVALELQMRGYDLEAGAGAYLPKAFWVRNDKEAVSRFRTPDGEPVRLKYGVTQKGNRSDKETLKMLRAEPVGSRGVVSCNWKNRPQSGHIWNYEITNEGLIFWDGHSGKQVPLDTYLSEAKRGSISYARLDNAEATNDLLEVVSVPEPRRK